MVFLFSSGCDFRSRITGLPSPGEVQTSTSYTPRKWLMTDLAWLMKSHRHIRSERPATQRLSYSFGKQAKEDQTVQTVISPLWKIALNFSKQETKLRKDVFCDAYSYFYCPFPQHKSVMSQLSVNPCQPYYYYLFIHHRTLSPAWLMSMEQARLWCIKFLQIKVYLKYYAKFYVLDV